jgi:hypothetical protein
MRPEGTSSGSAESRRDTVTVKNTRIRSPGRKSATALFGAAIDVYRPIIFGDDNVKFDLAAGTKHHRGSLAASRDTDRAKDG